MLEFQCQHTGHIYYLQDTEMKNFKQQTKSLSITSPEQLDQICLFQTLLFLEVRMKEFWTALEHTRQYSLMKREVASYVSQGKAAMLYSGALVTSAGATPLFLLSKKDDFVTHHLLSNLLKFSQLTFWFSWFHV